MITPTKVNSICKTNMFLLFFLVCLVFSSFTTYAETTTPRQFSGTQIPEKPLKTSLTIKVIGYQWYWRYEYIEGLGKGIGFNSTSKQYRHNLYATLKSVTVPPKQKHLMASQVENYLILPANTKIKFLITSKDVIHSWWVPKYGIKRDAIPGVFNTIAAFIPKTGIFRGKCTELCGRYHAYMPIGIKVVSVADYRKWVQQQNR